MNGYKEVNNEPRLNPVWSTVQIACLKQVPLEINESRFGPIYKNRGYVRQQQNKIDDAKQDYQNYIKFTPNAKDRGMIERALNEM